MSHNTVSWSLEFRPEIDFCVWALRYDGLRVTPFDGHDPGTSELERAGLSAGSWTAWLERVVAVYESIDGILGRADLADLEEDAEFEALARLLDNPAGLIDGSPDLRQKLGELWSRYQAHQLARRGWSRSLMDAGESLIKRVPAKQINNLLLYAIDYPSSVVLPLTERSVVVGRGPDTATLVNAIAEAASSSAWPRRYSARA